MTDVIQTIMSHLEEVWSSYMINGMDGLIYIGNGSNVSFE